MATFTVTTLVDENDYGGTTTVNFGFGGASEVPTSPLLSLREAIDLANDSAGADEIVFAAGLSGVIRLTNGELEIAEALSIDGGRLITVTGDANGDDITFAGGITAAVASGAGLLDDNSRVFNSTADLTLSGLTITGGRTTGVQEYGGGVLSAGSLTITDSVVSGNSTSGAQAGGGGAGALGELIVTNSTFAGNYTSGEGAGAGALGSASDVTITNSTITGNGNTGLDSDGGGVTSEGDITVINSIILGNGVTDGYGDEIIEFTDSGSDGLITILGSNIIGIDTAGFDVTGSASPASTGVAVNADPADVFDPLINTLGLLSGTPALNGGFNASVGLLDSVDNPALDAITLNGLDGRGFSRGNDLAGVDNGGTSDIGAFELLFQPPTAATITSASAFTVTENTVIAGDVEADDATDSEGNGLIYSIIGGADAALFSISASFGVISFIEPPDFENPTDANGDNTYEIEVQVRDAAIVGDTQAITISVTDQGEAPVASGTSATGDEDTDIIGQLAATDEDSANLTFALAQAPVNGDVVVNADGSFTYTPDPDFNGVDSFTFTVSDGVQTDTETVDLTVNAVDDEDVPTLGDDNLVGTPNADAINALDGNDTINGLAENDTLIGGDGDDRVIGGDGDDQLRGDAGLDTLEGGLGNDDISGGGGNDSLLGAGGDDLMRGNNGLDTLLGGLGEDDLGGGGGQDQIFGGGGADEIIGNGGADDLRGNGGADTIDGGLGGDAILGGAGRDEIRGNSGADDLRGNGGADIIFGGVGADSVKGGAGADTIDGGGGADFLEGGDGADVLAGRAGDDTLKGDAGADTFQFRAADTNDTILDFRQGQDLIEIITGAAAFADLVIEQDGADVLIGFGAGQVRVITDDAAAFDENDFIFAGDVLIS